MPNQPRHAAPPRLAIPRATHTVRFWSLPIVISVALMTALAALYLGGILNPASNLRHFPIAVVNDDAGPSGAQIVDGLVSEVDKSRFDVRVLSAADALHQLDTAQIYGQMLIPSDFPQRLQALAQTAAQPGSSTSVPSSPSRPTRGRGRSAQALRHSP
ncbi:MAG: hypothetical protein QOC62_1382 [Mycobacterium sp.]|jgi:uncharacterized phage infection (PIP) family protein YhgE|nr:hypothetical protein [Mycobacterium sp.]